MQVVDFRLPQDDEWGLQYIDVENDRILVHCPALAELEDTLVHVQYPSQFDQPDWAGSHEDPRFYSNALLWHPYEGQRVAAFDGRIDPDSVHHELDKEARLEVCVKRPGDPCVISFRLIVYAIVGGPVGRDPEPKCRFIRRDSSGRVSTVEAYTGEVYRFAGTSLPNQPDKQIVHLIHDGRSRLFPRAENNLIRWACRRGWVADLELIVPDDLPGWADSTDSIFSLQIHPDFSEPVVVFAGRVPPFFLDDPANLQLLLYHPQTPGDINRTSLAVWPRCKPSWVIDELDSYEMRICFRIDPRK